MADFLYDNINLGSGAGAINAGITGTILANSFTTSSDVVQIEYRFNISGLGINVGDQLTQQILFLLPNLDVAPTLTWIEPAAALLSVVSSVLTASGKTPAGIFEAFYNVTVQREQAGPIDTWFAYPVVTDTDGVAGLFPPITAQS